MLPVTKHIFFIHNAYELLKVIPMAFQLALSGRPGPVAIDIPKNIQAQFIEGRDQGCDRPLEHGFLHSNPWLAGPYSFRGKGGKPLPPVPVSLPESRDLDQFLSLLNTAKKTRADGRRRYCPLQLF